MHVSCHVPIELVQIHPCISSLCGPQVIDFIADIFALGENCIVKFFLHAVPSSGLYFTLAGTVYLPGDTVFITDIGAQVSSSNPTDPGTSLVCVTSIVNTECCRGSDNPNGGSLGEWFFNGNIIPRNSESLDFSRSGFTEQVRLNRRNDPMGPIGAYECRVPPLGGGTVVTASIILTTGQGTP